MAARVYFDRELEDLHLEMIKMGSLVEESIDNTIIALKNQDIDLAKKIILDDDIIDDMEKDIEKKCLKLIASQQPLAKDLRTISTALKIITDLERIGDHSSDISKILIDMSNEKYIRPLIDLPKMAEISKSMVSRSIDSYVKNDIELATAVCIDDDLVDDLFYKILLELRNIMKNQPNSVEQAMHLSFIAKYLERIGDHATNICEWVGFSITGEHKKLSKHENRDTIKNPYENAKKTNPNINGEHV